MEFVVLFIKVQNYITLSNVYMMHIQYRVNEGTLLLHRTWQSITVGIGC